MRPYDQDLDPWHWEFEEDTMDWPWPTFSMPQPDAFYEPCPLGCNLGSATYGNGIPFPCPACAGSGIGKPHSC